MVMAHIYGDDKPRGRYPLDLQRWEMVAVNAVEWLQSCAMFREFACNVVDTPSTVSHGPACEYDHYTLQVMR